MSFNSQAATGGIERTIEWILIRELRRSNGSFSLPGVVGSAGSTRTLKLRNAINDLELQIRRTFTILRFDLLLLLQDEVKEETPKEDSRQESSAEDTDDAFSQSSTESHLEDHPSDILPQGFDPIQPSVGAARSRLEGLCKFLEARVNRNLSTPGQTDNTFTKYPRLTQLIERIKSMPDSSSSLDLIPITRSKPKPFLFNIAKDEATAKAFADFTDPSQKRPPKETRNRMTEDAKEMAQFFLSFNSFVDALQMSADSLDDLTWQPTTKRLASGESFASFSLLRKLQRQTETACRAVLSHIGSCTHPKHEVLLQLPGWEEVSDWDATKSTVNLPVPLFFTMCLLDKKTQKKTEHDLLDSWQYARMFFLQPDRPGKYTERALCEALRLSHRQGIDLEFYVPEHHRPTIPVMIPIHIPSQLQRTRKYGKCFPSHSLWSLIEQGRLKERNHPNQRMSFNEWLNASREGHIIGIQQRKALAIKMVLGLMLSLDSDYVFETWDLRQVHLLESVNTYTPFVSLPSKSGFSTHQKPLSLATFPSLGSIDDLDVPEPSLQFVFLAKALLQIAQGERLTVYEQDSFANPWEACGQIQEDIQKYTQMAICGVEVDREIFPFFNAARGCLDFHMKYPSRLMESQSSHKMEVAWKLVFDTILVKIDNTLTLESMIAPGSPVLAQEQMLDPPSSSRHEISQQAMPIDGTLQSFSHTTITKVALTRQPSLPSVELSQPNVQLFDTQQGTGSSTAKAFWTHLETFHKSYARFVADRKTIPGGESPRRIRIAVIDTGVDFGHGGLADAIKKDRIKEEWCHSWVGANAKDESNELHGTNCAYLLHKSAPEADIYIAKVFNQNAAKSYEAQNIAKAIEHAVTKWDVDIISMSFGLARPGSRNDEDEAGEHSGFEKHPGILDDIETAIRKASPRLMFAAASNSGKNEPRAFPASDDQYVFCVHASTGNGQDGGINPEVWSGFNFMTLGMGLDLMEKEDILDPIKRGKMVKQGWDPVRYKQVVKSGTSFATPIAAGIAATVLDLAARVKNIDERAKKKLKTPEGMQKMLRLMSTPKGDTRDRMCYMAPWHHWENGWEGNEAMRRWVWDEINVKVGRY